jgi:hypothetical protein
MKGPVLQSTHVTDIAAGTTNGRSHNSLLWQTSCTGTGCRGMMWNPGVSHGTIAPSGRYRYLRSHQIRWLPCPGGKCDPCPTISFSRLKSRCAAIDGELLIFHFCFISIFFPIFISSLLILTSLPLPSSISLVPVLVNSPVILRCRFDVSFHVVNACRVYSSFAFMIIVAAV